MNNRYLFITEDGSLTVANSIPPEVIEAHSDGIWDIVDMQTGKQYVGEGTWELLDEQTDFSSEEQE